MLMLLHAAHKVCKGCKNSPCSVSKVQICRGANNRAGFSLARAADDSPEDASLPRYACACGHSRKVATPKLFLMHHLQPVRQSLPITAYRDHITSTIENNQVTVLCGETGWYAIDLPGCIYLDAPSLICWRVSGKSTQTPTMILESELSKGRPVKIFCTEPRRISAISLAQRVSLELGESPGSLGSKSSYIGYNIRLETQVSTSTRLTYATTVCYVTNVLCPSLTACSQGILLRMLEGDTELDEVTHIIIDEVCLYSSISILY